MTLISQHDWVIRGLLNDVDNLRAENKRLRAIEEAARDLLELVREGEKLERLRIGDVIQMLEELEAALAAKENRK